MVEIRVDSVARGMRLLRGLRLRERQVLRRPTRGYRARQSDVSVLCLGMRFKIHRVSDPRWYTCNYGITYYNCIDTILLCRKHYTK